MEQDDSLKKAEEIIYQASEQGTTKLDLGEMGLTELPESIGRVNRLTWASGTLLTGASGTLLTELT